VLRASRANDFGVAGSTIVVMAILMIFLFPLLSRPSEPGGSRSQSNASVQADTAKIRLAAAVAAPRSDPGATEQAAAVPEGSHGENLKEMSLGLTLILGVALLAMALGSRGRPS
jgi:hypothetical protein